MIFSRRSLQSRLDALRQILSKEQINDLIRRLNRRDAHRLPAMWELVILHACSRLGNLQSEAELSTGRRPDVFLDYRGFHVTADITAVSDSAIRTKNPVERLRSLIQDFREKLGFPARGLVLNIGHTFVGRGNGRQMILKLPDKARLDEFFKTRVAPELKSQAMSGQSRLYLKIDDDEAEVEIIVDPSLSPYDTTSHISYDTPQAVDRNPFFSALDRKADQLKDAPGIVGIFVGDANSKSLAPSSGGNTRLDAKGIVAELFRKRSGIDFVVIFSVGPDKTIPNYWLYNNKVIVTQVYLRDEKAVPTEIKVLLSELQNAMPNPHYDATNGAYRAQSGDFDRAVNGSEFNEKNKFKVSSRIIMELLAGRITIAEMNQQLHWRQPDDSQARNMLNPFHEALENGQLPVSIAVERTGEDGRDDWIEFSFGPPDPAISPFK